MYFNTLNERAGNLFVKPFRSKHVADDRYLKRVAQYIHFNPIELFEPGWKEGRVGNLAALEDTLRHYPFSSLPDYESGNLRLESNILDAESVSLIKEDRLSLAESLTEMREYYLSLAV